MTRNVTFECVWRVPAPQLREEAKALWRRYRAIEGEDALERRAEQIVFVVRDQGGQVVAVSTAQPMQAAFLNNHFFFAFRCFVAPSFRVPGLDSMLAVKTKAILDQQEGGKGKFKGMLIILENETLKKARTRAAWTASAMFFAGYTRHEHPVWVGYFKGARI